MGRLGFLRPVRARRTARTTALTASGWPMTRSFRRGSMFTRTAFSSPLRAFTGMPVQLATTSSTSCSVTSGKFE